MSISKKAALYARVSTEAQWEEGYSIDAQKEMLAAYCKTKGIAEYEYYIDGGFSGASIKRPALEKLTEDIKQGEISSVIVYKLDRFSRSQKDTLYLIEDVLIPNGVAFVSMNENMDTSTPIGRAMLGIMSAFAQLERETIKERTRMGMLERVKNGFWMGGGKIPFGYDYDKESGKLVPNEDAQTVRDVYSLYLQGISPRKIAQLTGLKYEHHAIQILKRKSNTGCIVYKGKTYENCHEPIISAETYRQAMEFMKKRSRAAGETKCLLAGVMYCGVCGAKMRYQKWSGGKYKIYCYSQDNSKTHIASNRCDNTKTDAEELEQEVLRDLFGLCCKKYEGVQTDADVIKILENTVSSYKKRLIRLYDLYSQAQDDLLLSEINRKKDELAKAQLELDNERDKRIKAGEIQKRFEKLGVLESAWAGMTVSEKRGVINELIDKIVITYDRVDIYYSEGTISRG